MRVNLLLVEVDSVVDRAESARYKVGLEAELGFLLQLAGRCNNLCLLLVNTASIEDEGLGSFSTKDQHLALIERNTSDREALDEVWVSHFKIVPILLCQVIAILTSNGIAAQIERVSTVEHTNHE